MNGINSILTIFTEPTALTCWIALSSYAPSLRLCNSVGMAHVVTPDFNPAKMVQPQNKWVPSARPIFHIMNRIATIWVQVCKIPKAPVNYPNPFVQIPNAPVIYPNDCVKVPKAPVIYPNGCVKIPKASVIYPNSFVIVPKGCAIYPISFVNSRNTIVIDQIAIFNVIYRILNNLLAKDKCIFEPD